MMGVYSYAAGTRKTSRNQLDLHPIGKSYELGDQLSLLDLRMICSEICPILEQRYQQ